MQTAFKDGSVMVCGTLPKDAVYKTVGQSGSSLTTFSVKVGEKPSPDVNRKADAVLCNCECWHSVARAAQHLRKGDTVLCVGKIKVEQWTDKKDSQPRTAKKLVCEFVIPMPVAAAAAPVQTDTGDLSGYADLLSDGAPF